MNSTKAFRRIDAKANGTRIVRHSVRWMRLTRRFPLVRPLSSIPPRDRSALFGDFAGTTGCPTSGSFHRVRPWTSRRVPLFHRPRVDQDLPVLAQGFVHARVSDRAGSTRLAISMCGCGFRSPYGVSAPEEYFRGSIPAARTLSTLRLALASTTHDSGRCGSLTLYR